MTSARALIAALGLSFLAVACGDDTATTSTTIAGGDSGPSVSITSPQDGDTVSAPVKVEMAAQEFTIEPAGEVHEDAGHFHLLVDVGCMAAGETIPSDTENFNHYGKAQMEAELDLEPGEHTLCLQAGDGSHKALELTDQITITVE
jgi:hypothetical protein